MSKNSIGDFNNFKIGYFVICINNQNMNDRLTINKKYTILDIAEFHDGVYIHIQDDKRTITGHHITRFVLWQDYIKSKIESLYD